MIESIELRRGPCEGTCPVYEVTFRRDLTAEWIGKAFVDRIGSFVGQFSEDEFPRLEEQLVQDAFFSWEDTLPDATCIPDVSIEVHTSDGEKRVTQWAGSETKEFRRLAAAIDRAAARVDWVRAEACSGPTGPS